MTVGQVSGTSTLYIQTISSDSAYADFTARIDGNIYITKRVNVRKAYDGAEGTNGQSTFKSTAFIRTNTALAEPSGGSYESPVPTTAG